MDLCVSSQACLHWKVGRSPGRPCKRGRFPAPCSPRGSCWSQTLTGCTARAPALQAPPQPEGRRGTPPGARPLSHRPFQAAGRVFCSFQPHGKLRSIQPLVKIFSSPGLIKAGAMPLFRQEGSQLRGGEQAACARRPATQASLPLASHGCGGAEAQCPWARSSSSPPPSGKLLGIDRSTETGGKNACPRTPKLRPHTTQHSAHHSLSPSGQAAVPSAWMDPSKPQRGKSWLLSLRPRSHQPPAQETVFCHILLDLQQQQTRWAPPPSGSCPPGP